MLKSTHIKIAQLIGSELKLPREAIFVLELGSVAPDEWEDFPHHVASELRTKRYIMEARRYFVNGQKLESLNALGIAFHYIQDRWVTVSSENTREHIDWERKIDSANIIPLEQVAAGLANLTTTTLGIFGIYDQITLNEYLHLLAVCTRYLNHVINNFQNLDGQIIKEEIFHLIDYPHPSIGTPFLDVNFSHVICLLVALTVFLPEINPLAQEKVEKIRKEYQIKLKEIFEKKTAKMNELTNRRNMLKRGPVWDKVKSAFYSLKIKIEENKWNRIVEEVRKEYYIKANEETKPFTEWYKIVIPILE